MLSSPTKCFKFESFKVTNRKYKCIGYYIIRYNNIS